MRVTRRLGIKDVLLDEEDAPSEFKRGGVSYEVRSVLRRNDSGTKFHCEVWNVENRIVEISKQGEKWYIQPVTAWTEE